MGIEDDQYLRLSAQRALLGRVTSRLRAVSVDIDSRRLHLSVRFIFNTTPRDSDKDAAACAGAEIIADYPGGWTISEEFVMCALPVRMSHLRVLVYARCEDP